MSSPSSGRAETAKAAASAKPAATGEPDPVDLLQARLGWSFNESDLLFQALSHRSWCAETGGRPSNERLEFLGDAVLGLVVAEHCYAAYPVLSEGSLAKIRASVVNTGVLAEVGAELGLGDVVMLGRGEDSTGGRSKPSILANTTEAVIGAVYLDGGPAAARGLVMRLLDSRISVAAAGPGSEDFKTRLQEVVAQEIREVPQYEVTGTGPDHARRYTAQVFVAGEPVGEGAGRSKKDAEQAAARVAWDFLNAHGRLTERAPVVASSDGSDVPDVDTQFDGREARDA